MKGSAPGVPSSNERADVKEPEDRKRQSQECGAVSNTSYY
jgi:hypothetical protein